MYRNQQEKLKQVLSCIERTENLEEILIRAKTTNLC